VGEVRSRALYQLKANIQTVTLGEGEGLPHWPWLTGVDQAEESVFELQGLNLLVLRPELKFSCHSSFEPGAGGATRPRSATQRPSGELQHSLEHKVESFDAQIRRLLS
jgi:hypothetical protein